MSQKNVLLFSLLSLLLLLLLYNMERHAREDFLAQKAQLVTFEKEAKEIGMLKKRFGDKKATRRALESLKRISTPQKEFVKGSSRVLVFEQLDGDKLNALLRKIANSGIVLKRLQVSRTDDLHAKVRLEMVK